MRKRIISTLLLVALCVQLAPVAFAMDAKFSDVSSTDWFYDDVIFAVQNGLVNGKTADTYEPYSELTYAEAVKLAAAMNQLHVQGFVSLESGDPWYEPYVDYAIDNGIIEYTYRWDRLITRDDFMDIFSRALPTSEFQAINTVDDGVIPDVPMTDPYAGAIYMLYRAGILTGSDEARNALPGDYIKRSEVAAILTRMTDPSERVHYTFSENESTFKITSQPSDIGISAGEAAAFSVSVEGGTAPYTYQWQILDGADWIDIWQAHSATYVWQNVQSNITLRCQITDAEGEMLQTYQVTASVAELQPMWITHNPPNEEKTEGDYATFVMGVEGGSRPYSYAWYSSTQSSGADPRTESSPNGYYLQVRADSNSFDRYYFCTVTDANGSTITSSGAKLTETPTLPDLVITKQPTDATNKELGDQANFSVAAEGAGLTYTWYQVILENSPYIPIELASGSTLNVHDIDLDDFNSFFYCMIRDSSGNAAQSDAAFIKPPTLEIFAHPESTGVLKYDYVTATLVSSATGGIRPYDIEWQFRVYGSDTWYNFRSWDTIVHMPAPEVTYSDTGSLMSIDAPENMQEKTTYYFRCVFTDGLGNEITSNVAEVNYHF